MPNLNGIQASIIINEKICKGEIELLKIIMITAHDSDQMLDKVKEIKKFVENNTLQHINLIRHLYLLI